MHRITTVMILRGATVSSSSEEAFVRDDNAMVVTRGKGAGLI